MRNPTPDTRDEIVLTPNGLPRYYDIAGKIHLSFTLTPVGLAQDCELSIGFLRKDAKPRDVSLVSRRDYVLVANPDLCNETMFYSTGDDCHFHTIRSMQQGTMVVLTDTSSKGTGDIVAVYVRKSFGNYAIDVMTWAASGVDEVVDTTDFFESGRA